MVRVNQSPGFTAFHRSVMLVNEVATLTVVAVALLGEGVASFGLIGSIMFHVDP